MQIRSTVVSNRSVEILILAGSALLIALLWGAMIFQLRLERTRAIEAAVRENQNRAIALEQYVTRTLEAAELAAVHLGQRYRASLAAPAPGRPPQPIVDPVAANPLFAEIEIADRWGDVRWSSETSSPAFNVADRAGFRRLRDNPQQDVFISRPIARPAPQKPITALARRITNDDGSFVGGIHVEIGVERFVDLAEGATVRPQDVISMIRRDGFTIARRTGGRVSFGEDLRGTPAMRNQARDPNGTFLGASAPDGVRRYFSHRRLKDYPVFVTAGVAEDDVLADVRRRARLYYGGLTILSLAILAAALMLVRGLRRRETAARELSVANLRLVEAQRIGRIGSWDHDLQTGAFHASDELRRMHGLPLGDTEISSDDLFLNLSLHDRHELEAAIEHAIGSREPQECEFAMNVPGDGQAFRRVRIAPSFDGDGKVNRLVGTEQDVTAEKQHEQLRDEVAHLARVESMNAMAVTIAHELSQPLTAAANHLTAVKIFAQRRAAGDEARISTALDLVERQIALTSNIVRRAREMVAGRAQTGESASLTAIVDDAISLVRMANDQPRVEMIARLDPKADCVAADKVQVQQVVMNLLRNASEAVKDEREPRVVVSSERFSSNEIVLCVADNGPGISGELGDIFSPFASTKSGGLGLGLSICRAIIQSFGGRIWVDRTRQSGAAICFSLPAAGASARRSRRAGSGAA